MTAYNKYHSDKWDGWMRAALLGDQNAYRLLLSNLRPWLISYFSRKSNPAAAEDLAQDTLMTLHAKRHTFDPAQSFGPWISAVARHRWIDYMRKTIKHAEARIEEEKYDLHDVSTSRDIKNFLALLPPGQAQVIEMAKLKQMSVQEVSASTGHSQASVKVMIHRGMKRMIAAAAEKKDE